MNKQSQSKYKRNEKWADTAESIAALWAELKDGDYIEVRLVLVHNPVWMRRIRDQAASTPIEADGEQVFAKLCVLASREGGSTTERNLKNGLGTKGWGALDARLKSRDGKATSRLEIALNELEKAGRIERRRVRNGNRVFPIAGGAA